MSRAAALATPASPGDERAPELTSTLPLRAVIAHDWLVQYGGSERAVEELRCLLPRSRLVTTLLRADELPPALADAETTFLQRIPGACSHHEWLLPAMPLAWRAVRRVDDADVVISSSHACAKAIRVGRGIPHVCYCYTPMRYAWDFQSEQARIAAPLHGPARLLMRGFRRWDVATSHRVTKFVAISHAVAERIAAAYGRTAEVIHPPVRTEFFTPGGERDDFFLYVGRLVAYKRADLVVEAFSELPTHRLVVVGHGHLEQQLRHRATSNVTFLGAVDDDRLRSLYRSARALVYPANEDFGITMAEAQACGTPVIGLARGGATDIVSDGETGWLVDVAHPREVRAAVRKASMESLSPVLVRARAEQFSAAEFRRKMLDVLREAAASSGASDI